MKIQPKATILERIVLPFTNKVKSSKGSTLGGFHRLRAALALKFGKFTGAIFPRLRRQGR